VLHSEDVYNATKTYDLEHICSAALGGKVGSAAYGGATTLCEDEKKKGVKVPACFVEFSLCLSRACLGKMIVFIYKWLKNTVFRRHRAILLRE
jgi:hypothetical protein